MSDLTSATVLLAGCCTGAACYSYNDDRGHALPAALYPTASESTSAPPEFAGPHTVALIELGEATPSLATSEAVRRRPELVSRVIPATGRSSASASWDDDTSKLSLAKLLGIAKEAGADCLIIVGGASEGMDQYTALSVLDITLIGAYLVPSRKIDIEARCNAIVIDVESGRLLATGTSEISSRVWASTVTAEGAQARHLKRVLEAGRVAAVSKALDEMSTKGAIATPTLGDS